MGFKDWFKWGKKESPSRQLIAMRQLGQPVSTPRNYEGFSKEGYQKNIIAYRAIKGIADAAKGIPWVLHKKRKGGEKQEILEHDLLTLLRRPNPMQGQAAFIESLIAFLNISGNSYCSAIGPMTGGPPNELWPLRPDRMKVIPGASGLPQAYEYRVGGVSHRYEVDQIKGKSPVLHLKTFNPIHDWYGMSPVEAAAYSVDQHNEAGKWNLALLQNSASPSGALVVQSSEGNPDGTLGDEQFERVNEMIKDQYSGSRNAGKPLLLEGGLDWKAMGLSPKDMDWISGKNVSSREVALAFGFPPILLGIQGDSTYNNQKEAKLALYYDTVLPTMDFIRDEFNNWLTPIFGDDLHLDYDIDSIPVIAEQREAVWTRVQSANFLTINEKREAVGYEPVEGGDQVFVGMSEVPLEMATDLNLDDKPDDPPEDPPEDPDDKPDDDDPEEDENENSKKKTLKQNSSKQKAGF